MSTAAASRARQPKGVPVGGQFSTGAHPENATSLTAAQPEPTSYPRSADRPDADTWQFPGSVPRFDALTAYDDEAGTYTIGDDLHIEALSRHDRGWIDSARRELASLHRAGLTGDATAELPLFDAPDNWRLKVTTPSGSDLYIYVEGDGERTSISVVGAIHGGVSASEYKTTDQDALDVVVRRVVEAGALVDGWKQQVGGALGEEAWRGRHCHLAHYTPMEGPMSMTIRPSVGRVDTVASFNDGQLVDLSERVDGGARAASTDREQILADLGRRLEIKGGRRAGVPAKVEEMLAAAADTAHHPDVLWVDANQARARAVERPTPHIHQA